MFYTHEAGVLSCADGELKHSAKCANEGEAISVEGGVRLVCLAGKWTPPQ